VLKQHSNIQCTRAKGTPEKGIRIESKAQYDKKVIVLRHGVALHVDGALSGALAYHIAPGKIFSQLKPGVNLRKLFFSVNDKLIRLSLHPTIYKRNYCFQVRP
jgi:hypothetical protein